MDQARTFVSVRAFGIHTSVYDAALMDAQTPQLMRLAGITTLRYPGGGYADNYHFSTYKPTRWQAEEPPRYGYYHPGNDFGHFVKLLDQIPATAIITVNYGSNLAGTGGGEPAEAAAWVAYSNGDPSDTRVIGNDSTGYDWKTVGYWASLRASEPLPQDDGLNFLRIAHPRPVNIVYWEIGNEVFGNGWYEKDKLGFEEDLHAPYGGGPRKKPALSPQSYGKNVLLFAKAMKAVDPRIKIGAVLTTVPMDNLWGLDWNPGVLREAGQAVDFGIIHWYTGDLLPPDWKELNVPQFLNTPQTDLPQITNALLEQFKKYCGANAQNMQIAITEFGPRPYSKFTDDIARGLFVADGYLSWIEAGAVNIDYLELHAKFLSDKNVPEPPYYAVQLARKIFRPNDTVVSSRSNRESLVAHAVKRADGNLGLVLINKDPQRDATVRITVKGASMGTRGARVDYGKGATPASPALAATQFEGGNTFDVSVPAYTMTGIVVPKAQ
ncbi:MAG TPA: hypothetical protein VMU24_03935 [Candidatus Acidoferrales bacterium]|nr:hypothetical protein [Candidatus Acidoferrales bacterium]